MKRIITIVLIIHITALYACRKEEVVKSASVEQNSRKNEQVIEEVNSNLFNIWVLVKHKEYGPGTYPGPTSYLDAPWYEGVDQDTLIIFHNNLCEWRPVKSRVPNPTEWIYLGNNRLTFSGRPVNIMELSNNHLIITMPGIDTGFAYYYESLKN